MASIKDLGNGKYRISLCVDRQRASRIVKAKNIKDAERQAILLEENLRETGDLDKLTNKELKKMTFGGLYDAYMNWQTNERHKPIAEKTEQKYKDIMQYQLEPYFKGMKVIHITETDVNKFLRYLKTPEARFNKSKRKPYSDGTVKDAFTLLNGMLDYAVTKLKVISRNPCDGVDKPTIEDRGEMKYYNHLELAKLLEVIDEDTDIKLREIQAKEATGRYQAFTLQKEKVQVLYKKVSVYLAIYTAARRGEVLGIHRQDINFETGMIHMCHQVLYTKQNGIYMTDNVKCADFKDAYVNGDVLDLLRELIQELDKLFEVSNEIVPYTDRLFMALNNTKMHEVGGLPFPDNYSDWFKKLLEQYNLPPITFHKLRHSSVSFMLYKEIPAEVVAKVAGHKSTEQIRKTYGHVYDSEVYRAAKVFNDIRQLK